MMVDRSRWEKKRDQTVLIVDDERRITGAIEATLKPEGLRTIVAHNGEEALEWLGTTKVDLILSDVNMPGMSGLELVSALKDNSVSAAIPVVLITAQAGRMDRMAGIEAGAVEYLVKPFSPIELISLVQRALNGQSIKPRSHHPDPAAMPADQLVVYAQELGQLVKTERRQRRALEEAHQRLEELDRLKAAFLGVVTHELLTPFAITDLALQVISRYSGSLRPELREALDDLTDAIEEQNRMVSGVVKFAQLVNKRRQPRPEYLELSKAIPQAVEPAALMARSRGIGFRIAVSPRLPRVYADPELLGEAIFQMAHNSIKFNQPGGQAGVRARVSGGWVVIEVADTGVGLSTKQLGVLGQPFEQSVDALRRGRDGLGIGWTLVRYVADVHGGRTFVERHGPNRGTTFGLALPMAVPRRRGAVRFDEPGGFT